jgi:hypothetical protein
MRKKLVAIWVKVEIKLRKSLFAKMDLKYTKVYGILPKYLFWNSTTKNNFLATYSKNSPH